MAQQAAPRTRSERRRARPTRPAWPTLVRAVGLNRRHPRLMGALLAIIAGTAVLGLAPPLILKAIIDGPLSPKNPNAGYLNVLIGLMLGVVFVQVMLSTASSYLSSRVGQQVMFELRGELYRHLGSMSLRWFTAQRTGESLSRITSDVSAVQGVVTDTLGGIVSNLIVAASTLALMVYLDWRLALFCVAFMPLFLFPAQRVGNMQRAITSEIQENVAKMNGHMHETLSVSGHLLVRTYGREEYEAGRFDELAANVRDLSVKRSLIGRWWGAGMQIFGAVAPAIVYWYGGQRVIGGEASLGTVVAFSALLGRMFGPVQGLMGINISVLSSIALFERIFDYMDLDKEIHERPDAIALGECQGEVAFEHVSFSYIRGKPVLHDISFRTPAATFTALVGHSGAGKTTTAYLVPRLYDVDSGCVRLDGHDVRDLTLETMSDHVATVSQETYLFHDTIGNNIRYGRPDATDEEVRAAAEAANIAEFIDSLPAGLETMVGERGYRLSGGEKQRVSIARAILKNPAVLILDEATSSVDSRTERAIQQAVDRLTRGRTVIAIAHRLSTVRRADQILVFDRGRIVERGTHAELLAQGGEYAEIYMTQFRGEEEEAALV